MFRDSKQAILHGLQLQIAEIDGQIKERKEDSKNIHERHTWELQSKKWELAREIKSLDSKESQLNHRIQMPEIVPISEFEDFELSNLTRLGLVKFFQTPFANSQKLEIPYDTRFEERGYLNVDLDIDIDSDEECILTELGELFMQACTEKKDS